MSFKKTKKKLLVLLLLIMAVIVFVLACKFYPELISKYFDKYNINLNKFTSQQVLGTQTVNRLQPLINKSFDWFMALPIVEQARQEAEKKVQEEFNKALDKPKNEVEKVKNEVRQTVCEDWLPEKE